MKFTSTELRRDSAAVYNAVMTSGMVHITHRDRPEMVLLTYDKLKEMVVELTIRSEKETAKG